jgi:hypothetical protein
MKAQVPVSKSSQHPLTIPFTSFAQSPDLFARTCATLFARMVDTVPDGVTLTEVIEPLPVKPHEVQVIPMGDGVFVFRGEVRVSLMSFHMIESCLTRSQFWDMSENDKRVVNIFWLDRSGSACSGCQATLGHTIDQAGSSNTGQGHKDTALWYSFNRTETDLIIVNPALGISNFWFTVQENGKVFTYNQGGTGFPVQDTLLVANSSCFTFNDNGDREFHLKIAVCDGSLTVSSSSTDISLDSQRCSLRPDLRGK